MKIEGVIETHPERLNVPLKPSNNLGILIGYGDNGTFPPYSDTSLSNQQTGEHSPVGVSKERESFFSETALSQGFLPNKEGAHRVPIRAEFFSDRWEKSDRR